jgi:hypothetical protein
MDRRSFGLGVLVGGAMVATIGAGTYLVSQVLESDSDFDVTAEEVQLSAMRAFVDAHGIPIGSDVASTTEFGGLSCGGVVEVEVDDLREVYIVRQDSGEALPAERTDLSVDGAKGVLSREDERCF